MQSRKTPGKAALQPIQYKQQHTYTNSLSMTLSDDQIRSFSSHFSAKSMQCRKNPGKASTHTHPQVQQYVQTANNQQPLSEISRFAKFPVCRAYPLFSWQSKHAIHQLCCWIMTAALRFSKRVHVRRRGSVCNRICLQTDEDTLVQEYSPAIIHNNHTMCNCIYGFVCIDEDTLVQLSPPASRLH